LVLWGKRRRWSWRRGRALEGGLYGVSLLLCALFIWGAPPFGAPLYPLGFLCLPVLIWPAFRFGRREASTATLLLAGIAVWRTRLGYGPFVMESLNDSFLALQVFMATIAVTVLSLAAVVLERERAAAEIQRSHDELEERIHDRTAALSAAIELLRREIEQREAAQRELRESQRALEMAQALAHIGSWTWDIPTNRVSWSDELHRIFGLEPGAMVITYERYLELLHPEDRGLVDATLRRSAQSGAPFEFEHRAVRPDGAVRWLYALGQVTMGPQGALRVDGTAHDITERKQAETERKRLEQEILEVSGREQQRLGHDLHDDLGQLLTGIALMTKSLEKQLRARSLPETAALAEIRALVNQAIGKTRNLARVLSPVGLEEGGVVSALQELSASAERVFNVSCSLVCAETVSIRSELAGVHIYRIVQEAISNAVRHGKADRIQITLEPEGDALRLEVHDNGSGLPSGWDTRSGFGLRIMKYRAGLIGGRLDIRSTDGETVVSCTVPGIVVGDEAESDPAA
jgi:PAS domain S-box-containing protein